ncbi:MAG: hypothetical protein JW797_00970 [Bradymonadales bacterium]|nr:hypothetical protein [Bradymonadales bacterium]
MKLRRTSIALLFAACTVLSTSAWAGNGQNLLQYVPQNSYMVVAIDVAQIWNTPFMQTMWGMVTADPSVGGPLGELQTQTGFNPTNDLQTLVLALTPAADNHFVLLVEGNFNPDALGTFISSQAGEEVAVTQYQGQTVYYDPTEPELNRSQFSFINNNLAVIGTMAESNAVLDILAGTGANIMANPELGALLGAADMSGMVWFAGLTTPQMQTEMAESPMAGIQSMRGTASLAGGLTMNTIITTTNAEQATNMAMFINQSLQEARANPELAQMGLAGVIDGVTATSSAQEMTLAVAIPEQTVNQVLGIVTALVQAQQMAAQEQMMVAPPAAEPEPAAAPPAEPQPEVAPPAAEPEPAAAPPVEPQPEVAPQ